MHRSVAVALLLASACAQPRVQAISALPCPPADSLYNDLPPGPGRDMYSTGPYPRFIAYVIDSVYVVRVRQGTATDTVTTPSIVPESDIESIDVRKGAAGERWSGCAGIPAILITTKSRQWRPPAP